MPLAYESRRIDLLPRKFDPKLKERCVQQMLGHVAEYLNPMAATQVVGERNGVGAEKGRRWSVQAQLDSSDQREAASDELAEINELKAKVR